MMRRGTALWLLLAPAGLVAAEPAPVAEATACREASAGQVFAFELVPPPPALRPVLAAGRAYLRRGAALARECARVAGAVTSGYAVATLRPGRRLSFSAPERLSPAALRCLARLGKRLSAPPQLPPGAEVHQVWLLGTERAPPPGPPRGPAVPAVRRSLTEIEAEVRRHLLAIGSCLEEPWLTPSGAGAGTLILRLTIGEHGGVEETAVARSAPALGAAEPCLRLIFSRMHFPPRWGAGRSTLFYPLSVQLPAPQGEGQARTGGQSG